MKVRQKIWDIRDVFEAQRVLDQIAFKNANTSRTETHSRRRIATVIEIAETIDEIQQIYKYWKKNIKPMDKEQLLDELADVFHFIVSIGIDVNAKEAPIAAYYHENVQVQLLDLISWICSCNGPREWDMAIGHFRGLFEMFGFHEEEMVAAYMKKNKENHERQASGY